MNRSLATEPAVTIGTVVSAVGAVLALLVAFGVDLTEGQTAAIVGLVVAVGPIAGFIIRYYVIPTGGEHRAEG